MIKQLFPQARIKKDFIPHHLSNVIQFAEDEDILYFNVGDEKKAYELLQRYLSPTFKGLIVATKKFEGLENYNYQIFNKPDFIKNQKRMIDHFYPIDKAPHVIGVTGTNGKTSTCWLMSELGRLNKKSILYIGTIGVYLSGIQKSLQVLTTTPSFLELRKIIYLIGKPLDLVCLEVSSHALSQERLGNIELKAAAWTNFSQDHLDYHGSMEEYFIAKRKIVQKLVPGGTLFFNKTEANLYDRVNYSYSKKAQSLKEQGIELENLFLQVDYNRKNLELALALYDNCFGKTQFKDLNAIVAPPGRLEVIEKKGVHFIIDYAHTPDAIKKLLDSIRDGFKDSVIITVVGCGGNRDKKKRPLMAQAAYSASQHVIFTSDNPRDEDPNKIIADMTEGLQEDKLKKILIIPERAEAIRSSLVLAKEEGRKSVVVIAGKGHESYQEIGGKRRPFSDRDHVNSL